MLVLVLSIAVLVLANSVLIFARLGSDVSASDVEKSFAVLEITFTVALDNAQRNRLRDAKPLIASVAVNAVDLFGDGYE